MGYNIFINCRIRCGRSYEIKKYTSLSMERNCAVTVYLRIHDGNKLKFYDGRKISRQIGQKFTFLKILLLKLLC